MVSDLLSWKEDLQILVVAGSNHALKRQIEKVPVPQGKKLMVLGYTDKIPELMAIADLIVTKPGGMTVSEALIKSLPMVIISPIPGHEEKNAQFLVNNGLAAWVFKEQRVSEVIQDLLIRNPLRLTQIREMTRVFSKPNAAKDTLAMLENLVDAKQN
jgi:processive 1,2-diacylglycerol beta-glucosyltransferase